MHTVNFYLLWRLSNAVGCARLRQQTATLCKNKKKRNKLFGQFTATRHIVKNMDFLCSLFSLNTFYISNNKSLCLKMSRMLL